MMKNRVKSKQNNFTSAEAQAAAANYNQSVIDGGVPGGKSKK